MQGPGHVALGDGGLGPRRAPRWFNMSEGVREPGTGMSRDPAESKSGHNSGGGGGLGDSLAFRQDHAWPAGGIPRVREDAVSKRGGVRCPKVCCMRFRSHLLQEAR